MNFCCECNNILYPKEDKERGVLLYSCRICAHQESAQDPRIIRREILHSTEEQTIALHDIGSDPTLPRTAELCPRCGYKEAVYFQSTSTDPKQAMTLYFVCCNKECNYRWKA